MRALAHVPLLLHPDPKAVAVLGLGSGTDPDQYVVWHSSQRGPDQMNRTGYANPEVDRLLELGRSSCVQAERVQYYHRIQQILAEDLPMIFLYTADALPVGDPRLDNNAFFRDYVMGAIEKELAGKGFRQASSGEPDLLVHYHASVNQKVDVHEADRPYGYCYQDCEPRVVEFEQGTLVVDIVDRRTNKVVWRGWAQDTMNGVIDNQDRLEKQVSEGVTKMMKLLPQGGATFR